MQLLIQTVSCVQVAWSCNHIPHKTNEITKPGQLNNFPRVTSSVLIENLNEIDIIFLTEYFTLSFTQWLHTTSKCSSNFPREKNKKNKQNIRSSGIKSHQYAISNCFCVARQCSVQNMSIHFFTFWSINWHIYIPVTHRRSPRLRA